MENAIINCLSLNSREANRQMVDHFDDDIALLHRIPLFPALLDAMEQSHIGGQNVFVIQKNVLRSFRIFFNPVF